MGYCDLKLGDSKIKPSIVKRVEFDLLKWVLPVSALRLMLALGPCAQQLFAKWTFLEGRAYERFAKD